MSIMTGGFQPSQQGGMPRQQYISSWDFLAAFLSVTN
jgi:hypothetical protein